MLVHIAPETTDLKSIILNMRNKERKNFNFSLFKLTM